MKQNQPLTKRQARQLSLVLDRIYMQQWHSFQKVALSNRVVFQMIWENLPKMPECHKAGKTLLHAILECDAPLPIVAQMLQMIPPRGRDALRAQDAMGRTPLHIAAGCGADPMVIRLLGGADPGTCTVVDGDGRTALHLACDRDDCMVMMVQDENDNSIHCSRHVPPRKPCSEARTYEIVRALLASALDASCIEDEEEMTALEYAILSGASLETVRLLQAASMVALRERDQVMSDDDERQECTTTRFDDRHLKTPLIFSPKNNPMLSSRREPLRTQKQTRR